MGIFYIILLLGTIVAGAVGLSGGTSGLMPPSATTITPTISPVQYVPIDVAGGLGKSTLQLNALAFGTITPTPTPTCTVAQSGNSSQQTTSFPLLGIIDEYPNQVDGAQSGTNQIAGDLGQVAVVGKYAYVSGQELLNIFDISTPPALTFVGQSPPASGTPCPGNVGMVVSGGYAYDISNCLAVYDISDATAPKEVSSIIGTTAFNGSHDLVKQGNYLYVSNYDGSNITVVDISNPLAPVVFGQTPSDTTHTHTPYGIAVSGNYAYTANQNSGNMAVFDISNPRAPQLIGYTSPGDARMSGGVYGIAISGSYAYVTGTQGLIVVDISVPTAPKIVGTLANMFMYPSTQVIGVAGVPDAITIVGNYAYIIDRDWNNRVDDLPGSTFAVVDISNPLSPTLVGYSSDPSNLIGSSYYRLGFRPTGIEVVGDKIYVVGSSALGVFQAQGVVGPTCATSTATPVPNAGPTSTPGPTSAPAPTQAPKVCGFYCCQPIDPQTGGFIGGGSSCLQHSCISNGNSCSTAFPACPSGQSNITGCN